MDRAPFFTLPSGVLLALLLWVAPSWAQDQPAKTFAGKTSVVVIEVPVNVVADGKPVRGLKAENFRVFDGKKEQPLAGFEVIDLEVVKSSPPVAVPAPARRRFLLFFDLAITPRADTARSLTAARALIRDLQPSDVVAVAAYTRGRGAELLLNFTTDRRQAGAVFDGIATVLDGKAPRASQNAGRDPLKLIVDRGSELALDVTSDDLAGDELSEMPTSSRGGAGIAETLRASSEANVERNKDRVRSYFRAMTTALSQFAAASAGLDGRRFFVFFSRGFDGNIFDDTASLDGVAGSGGGGSARTFLATAIQDFRRAGWEVHSVDPGLPGAAENQLLAVDSLLSFAKDTGGTLYRHFGNLGSAMAQMLDRTSVTYLLAFQVENVQQDGAFHPIRVELRGVPGGARVYHRDGFIPPTREATGIAKAVGTAERILSAEESGDLPLRSLLVPLRGPEGFTRVAVLLETSGAELLAGQSGDQLGVEVYAYAIDDNGNVEDFLAQQISLDAGKFGKTLATKSFGVFSDLSLRPGRYRLRVLLRQRQSGRQVLKTLPLEVADLSGAGPHLVALMMVEEGNDPMLIREKAGEATVPYPFAVGEGQEFFPALEPSLAGTSQRRLALFGYGLRGGGFSLAIDLKNDQGEKIEGHIQLVGAAPTQPDGLDKLYLLLDPKGLVAGKFQIDIAISADADGRVVDRTSLPWVVRSP